MTAGGDGSDGLDSTFRDAPLRPWRASPRPTPGAAQPPDAELIRLRAEVTALRAEVTTLQDELARHRDSADRARDDAAAEKQRLQSRIDELEAQQRPATPSPELAELARGIDGLADRMKSLAAPAD